MSASVAAAAAVGASLATRSDIHTARFDYAPASTHNPVYSWVDYSKESVSEIADRQRRGLDLSKVSEIAERYRRGMVEARINEIVEKGVSGILYKWINYVKGWRRRWFVLHDGVLSYYKIHGPDKIFVSTGSSVVIGRESGHFVLKNKHRNSQLRPPPKPLGEIHLKVSVIEESRSDDTKFTILTGKKMLHLRAGSYEDRLAWVEPLKTIKSMFPRMELRSCPVTTTPEAAACG